MYVACNAYTCTKACAPYVTVLDAHSTLATIYFMHGVGYLVVQAWCQVDAGLLSSALCATAFIHVCLFVLG